MRIDERRFRKRRKRLEVPGDARLLNFACFRNRPLLAPDQAAQWAVDAIDRARARHAFHLWAFVIMPDHVHLLIFPTGATPNVSTICASIKTSVARSARNFAERHDPNLLAQMRLSDSEFRFWQRGGGYDRNLWSPRYIWDAIDYIHNNPVRAGLCQSPSEWRWSSARAYEQDASEPLSIDADFLPPDTRAQL